MALCAVTLMSDTAGLDRAEGTLIHWWSEEEKIRIKWPVGAYWLILSSNMSELQSKLQNLEPMRMRNLIPYHQ